MPRIRSQYCGSRNGPAVAEIIQTLAIAMKARVTSRLTLIRLIPSLICGFVTFYPLRTELP